MDLLTHAFVPYALALLLRLPRQVRYAAAIGGVAPDLDVELLSPLAHFFPSLYFLGHRGVTHTLLLGPLWGLATLYVLSRPRVRAVWPARVRRFVAMETVAWTPWTRWATVAGAFSHVFLDFFTITGIPAFFPVSETWWTANVFFYSAWPLLLVSLVVLVQRVRGRLSDRGVVRGFAVWCAVAFVVAGVSLSARPSGGEAFPAQVPGQWTHFVLHENGTIEGRSAGYLVLPDPRWYVPDPPEDAAEEAAAERVRGLAEHRAFVWNAHGPVTLGVEPVDGGHRVTYTDILTRHSIDTSGFGKVRALFRGEGFLIVDVIGDEATVLDAPASERLS
ncbi:MAG: metal-dependent hydrolase [Methanobacteriota archaeon]